MLADKTAPHINKKGILEVLNVREKAIIVYKDHSFSNNTFVYLLI